MEGLSPRPALRWLGLVAIVWLGLVGVVVADDTVRIEGIIVAVHQNDFVLESNGQHIVVDMSLLGGITAAIVQGQAIAVIGTMASDGKTLSARRLESATTGR